MHIIIVGCGRVGAELARILSADGHNVTVLDCQESAFKRLGDGFNGTTQLGNGIDTESLRLAGVERADAVAVVTNGDNTNLMSAQVIKKIFGVPRVIARVYDPQRAHLYQQGGLDIISGTTLVAALIRDRISETKFSSFLTEASDLGTLEADAPEKLLGQKIGRLNRPGELKVVALVREHKTLLPEDDTALAQGDRLIALVKLNSLKKAKKLLELK
ncbi:MAG: TrkA family potassium uptake protein [Candidatus Margulisbacteria bacterium]|jgi:trk system potassium uptake protein TrkA|nr:TrkA family potassium uptake protein [Candidatus Margulisiibacteriota bacterium]